MNQQAVSFPDPLPALVPVHRIIPSYKRCQLTIRTRKMIKQLFQITFSALGVRIPSISKSMDKYIFDSIFAGHVTQRIQVFIERMNPSIR